MEGGEKNRKLGLRSSLEREEGAAKAENKWKVFGVTPVAAIVPATILAATAGAAERCDVCEGLLALPVPPPV